MASQSMFILNRKIEILYRRECGETQAGLAAMFKTTTQVIAQTEKAARKDARVVDAVIQRMKRRDVE